MSQQVSKTKILPVILSGGVGSRLWPLSRAAHPKPFIKLADGQSLIQKTYLRAASIEGVDEILTVTNRDLFFYTKDEYEALDKASVSNSFILEPFGRNSAPAIGLAAEYAMKKWGADTILLVLPADHLIEKPDAFLEALNQAAELAEQGRLVTFGIQPNAPETGYGYIEADGHDVKAFVEKPDLKTAEHYLASGRYLWNSGMFCMSAGTCLSEMELNCPDVFKGVRKCFQSSPSREDFGCTKVELSKVHFEKIDDISVDYALFEKSKNVAVVPCSLGWSDVGSWVELGQLNPKDKNENHIVGDVCLKDAQGCIIHGQKRLVAGLGIKDLIIADTQDVLLVADKNRAQEVRDLVSTLKKEGSESVLMFPTVHRPWGSYTVLQEAPGFKLKRIEVKPGSSLSLQSHQHRSEHWIVVSGLAKVQNGEQILHLEQNQSTYIPAGNKHRLENKGEELLTMIEVQCGDYLGEDDITRYEDVYGRG